MIPASLQTIAHIVGLRCARGIYLGSAYFVLEFRR